MNENNNLNNQDQQNVQQPQYKFDPNTGQPINPGQAPVQSVTPAPKKSSGLKIALIIIGVVLFLGFVAVIVFVVLPILLFRSVASNYEEQFEDITKDITEKYEQETTSSEALEKNAKIKDYKIDDYIIVEVANNNKDTVSADIKIEFYDASGSAVDIKEGYILYIPGKTTSYDKISTYGVTDYDKYKVSVKLSQVDYVTTYIDKVKIVSSSEQDGYIILQVKNESDKNIDSIEVGIVFYGDDNKVIEYESTYISDLAAGETTNEKVYVPYNYTTHSDIKYTKTEAKVVSAYSYNS